MAKNIIGIDLRVNADVKQAKAQINSLQKSLSELAIQQNPGAAFGDKFSESAKKAQKDIVTLKAQIESAVNVDTGKLDFTKFNNQLKNSNKSLEYYANTLTNLGPQGVQAFSQLTRAVANSEIPMLRLSSKVKELGTALANTARWQISSSVLHGFMGSIQAAYGYAQDLNRSLNDIRIVTGQSTEQMAEFAERANKAAQSLSATTTEYTNASLIFYQQGLSDEEVEARTNTTIKMAHAAGESATQVSSYMTAIWNNFADGAKNLEYYGDVITKLGATTAASSAEIAGGLEKFAAVADTVGLSYEYAAAAVTTIVDKTRQSEDVVGTSLKTIFARLEGLQLGDVLEDGTDLNKYSKALLTVGVNIKDVNGDLKSMDTILDELGSQWGKLSQDQKIALAQTVGGMRQYNQLIALMDNFDAFQENIKTASNAEGTLQKQADIYAESWEGAEKRVRAAAEAIYQDLLDDEFFIKLTNEFADVLKTIDRIIDSFGGLKGVLSQLAPIITQIFSKQITQGIQNLGYNINSILPGGREVLEAKRQSIITRGLESARTKFGKDSIAYKKFEDDLNYYAAINKYGDKISEIDKNILSTQHDINQQNLESLRQEKEKLDILQEQNQAKSEQYQENLDHYFGNNFNEDQRAVVDSVREEFAAQNYLRSSFSQRGISQDEKATRLNQFFDTMSDNEMEIYKNALEGVELNLEEYKKRIQEANGDLNELSIIYDDLNQKTKNLGDNTQKASEKIQKTVIESGIYGEDPKQQKLSKESAANIIKLIRGNGLKDFRIQDINLNMDRGTLQQKFKEYEKSLKLQISQGDKQGQSTATLNTKLKKLQEIYNKLFKDIDEYDAAVNQVTEDIITETAEEAQRESKEKLLLRNIQQREGQIKGDYDSEGKQASEVLAKNEALAKSFTQLTSVLTNVAAAYFQITSLSNAWSEAAEGNITYGQAFAQTAMALGMLIPTLVNIKKAMAELTVSTELLDQGLLKTAVSSLYVSLCLKTKTYATEEEAAAAFAAIVAEKGLAGALLEVGLMAKTAAAELWAAITPLLPLALVIGSVVAAVALYNKAQSNMQEEIDNNNKLLEKNKELLDNNKALTDNYNNLMKIKNAYEQGNDSLENYQNTILETANAYEIENAAILAQAGAYELLEQRIIAAQMAKDRETIRNSEETLDIIGSNINTGVIKNNTSVFDFLSAGMGFINTFYNGSTINRGIDSSDERAVTRYLDSLDVESGFSWTHGGDLDLSDFNSASSEDRVAILEALNEIAINTNRFDEESEIASGIRELGESLGGWDTLYEQASSEYSQEVEAVTRDYLTNQNLTSITDAESLSNVIQTTVSYLESQGYSEKYTDSVIQDYFSATLPDIYGDYALIRAYAEENSLEFSAALNDYNKNGAEFVAATIGASNALTELQSSISDLTSLLQNLKLGDRISAKDYEEKLNDYQKQFFQEMLDGSYQLIGNAQDLWDYTQTQFIEDSIALTHGNQQVIERLQEQIENENERASIPKWDIEDLQESEIFDAIKSSSDSYELELLNNLLTKIQDNPENFGVENDSIINEYKNEMLQTINELNDYNQKLIEGTINGYQGQIDELDAENRAEDRQRAFYYSNQDDLYSAFERGEFSLESYTAAEEHLRNLARLEGLNSEELENYTNYLLENNESLEGNAVAAENLAIHNMQMNKGIEDLSNSWENWNNILSSSEYEGTPEYANALESTKEVLSDILDISTASISNNVILDHLDLISMAAEGDIEAIDELKRITRDEIELRFDFNDSDLKWLHNEIENFDNNIEIGATIDDAEFIEQLNNMVSAAGMTADQVNDYLQSQGYEANFVEESQPVVTEVPRYRTTYTVVDSDDKGGYTLESNTEVFDVEKVEGMVPSWAMTTDGSSPKIASVTRVGSEGAKSKSKTSSNSGSGGGSSSKPKTKNIDTDSERYYTITRQIKDQEDAIKRLDRAKERAWGKSKLNLIEQEGKALERELELQEQYIDEIESYYKEDQAKVIGLGGQFDENGVLTNYDEIMANEIARYNAAGGSEEAENRWNYVTSVLKQYDETNQLWQEAMDRAEELANQIYDNKLDLIETELEIEISVNDDELNLLEYRLKHLEDYEYEVSLRLSVNVDELDKKLERQSDYKDKINKILANHGIGDISEIAGLSDQELVDKGFTSREIEDLREYAKEVLNIQQDIDAIQKTILEGPLTAMQEWEEEFDTIDNRIQHTGKMISTYLNIANLTKGMSKGINSTFIAGLQQRGFDNSLLSAKSANDYYQSQKESYDKLVKYRKDNESKMSEDQLQVLDKEIEEAEKMVMQAHENALSATENALKAAKDLFDATLQSIFDETNQKIYDGKTFAFADYLFGNQKDIDDLTLDSYESIYGLSKIVQNIDKELASSKVMKNTERLVEMREKINKILASGEKITEAKLKNLELEFELEKARAAWEDARNAKDTVRMTMDSEGNYGYLYSAGDTSKEEEAFVDKFYNHTHQIETQVKDLVGKINGEQARLDKEIKDIMSSDMTYDEKSEAAKKAIEKSQENMLTWTQDLDYLLEQNEWVYEEYGQQYWDALGYAQTGAEEYSKALADTYLHEINPTIQTGADYYKMYADTVAGEGGYLDKVEKALEEYKTNMDTTLQASGTSLDTFTEDTGDELDEEADRADKAYKLIQDRVTALGESFDTVLGYIDELLKKGLGPKEEDAQKVADGINRITNAYKNLGEQIKNTPNPPAATSGTPPSYDPGSGNSEEKRGSNNNNNNFTGKDFGADVNNSDPIEELAKWLGNRKSATDLWKQIRNTLTGVKSSTPAGYKTWAHYLNSLIPADGSKFNKEEFKKIAKETKNSFDIIYNTIKQNFSFDTGGYTGVWNSSEGRLAMLHEKELILNKQDTENMLKMLEVARNTINIETAKMQLDRFNKGISLTNNNGESFKQTVNINADFSGVRDSKEIEEAFNSLINQAIQYSNRKF